MAGTSSDDRRTNVLVLVGTRPEAIKMFPVVLALERSTWFAPVVVTTGQHRDLVAPILDLAGIEPALDLDVGRPGLTLNELVGTVIQRFDAFCRERFGATGMASATREDARETGFPVCTLVHGDTSSAAAAALASFNLRIPVGHVEAGLRTWTTLTPFPEEANRQMITRLAAFHLAPTALNRQNLVREGVPDERVMVTGNTGIDALRFAAAQEVSFTDDAVTAVFDSGRPYVVVTAHRRENWSGGLARIASAIDRLAEAHPGVSFVVSLHPNPVVRRELGDPLAGRANVVLTEPLQYAEFARLMGKATVIVTDSGGIQEEAPALGVPVLVVRDSTERVEGALAGTLTLVGTESDRIVSATAAVLADPAAHVVNRSANPYGDGQASDRIVATLEFLAGITRPPAHFGPPLSRRDVLEASGYPFEMFPPPVYEVDQEDDATTSTDA